MVVNAITTTTTMTLVMAEKDQPVFRDFLGLEERGVSKQQQQPDQYPSSTTTSDVSFLRGASRSSGCGGGGGFAHSEAGDVVETLVTGRAVATSSGTTSGGRFETTSSAPGYALSPSSVGLALPSSSEPGSSVGWQVCSTSSLQQQQQHGIRSAFCKPDFDSSRSSKVAKKKSSLDYAAANDRGNCLEQQQSLQMSVEEMENNYYSLPRPQKMARFEEQHMSSQQKLYGEVAPSCINDLRLSMQPPPRLSSSVNPQWLQQQQQASKPDVLNRNAAMMHEAAAAGSPGRVALVHSSCNSGLQVPALRVSHLSAACAEREERAPVAVHSRENYATGMSPPVITRPAADEGSRTGLKGSPLVGLINNSAAATGSGGSGSAPVIAAGSTGPPPLPRRPMNSTASGGGGGSDSMLPTTRQGPPPASRQLTIFYGGQAHVFDNVPSDKAEFILALAGSHGKSWSTTYSPRPNAASVPDSASEGSLAALEKEKTVQSHGGGGSASGRRSLPLSTDMQTLLRGYANTGNGTGCPS